ncbi:hypothetical protein THIOKS12820015 [Thiocapsa sp. KS1]|nr:hypothetical protein THIOKS12820015 [Thiocapsa sp. KS1]
MTAAVQAIFEAMWAVRRGTRQLADDPLDDGPVRPDPLAVDDSHRRHLLHTGQSISWVQCRATRSRTAPGPAWTSRHLPDWLLPRVAGRDAGGTVAGREIHDDLRLSMNITDLNAFRGLDPDIRSALLNQIRDLWTHGSTAIEGNTLTLGETKFARVRAHPPLLGRQRTLGTTGCEPPSLAIGSSARGDRREGPEALHRDPGRVSVGPWTAKTGERRLAPTGA